MTAKRIFDFNLLLQGIHTILRKGTKANKSSDRRAHLSPLVLILDGSLVGELETVQKAAQEVCVTALGLYGAGNMHQHCIGLFSVWGNRTQQ